MAIARFHHPDIQNENTYTARDLAAPAPAAQDYELFARFLRGDDNAAMQLFQTYNRRLFVYCAKIVSSNHVAEDICQEVWEKVLRLRQQNPTDIQNPAGFLFTIARNLCLNFVKLRKHTVPIESVEEYNIPLSVQPGDSSMEELIGSSLDCLRFEDRELLVLNMYCGYRFDEIAAMLGISANAVWTRASRARAQLREIVTRMMKKDN
jgi:RNA polymerase sigma-70 factor (ECF subfamily)